jgi:hypothetical protein
MNWCTREILASFWWRRWRDDDEPIVDRGGGAVVGGEEDDPLGVEGVFWRSIEVRCGRCQYWMELEEPFYRQSEAVRRSSDHAGVTPADEVVMDGGEVQ